MRRRGILRPLRLMSLASMLWAALLCPAWAAQGRTIRGHSVGGHGSGGHAIHLHSGFGFFASYYYLPHYYPYGYYYPPYPAYYAPAYLPDVAYIDTDVSPEEAEVYLDGEYVGTADDYDGFPGYLSVTPGRHNVSFKAGGYRSVTRAVRVPRGAVLDLEFTLAKGSGAEGPKGEKDDEEIVVPEHRHPEPSRDQYSGDQEGGNSEGAEPGFVRIDVTPADASVYVDGKLYGSASRLSRLHGDLRLESGRHKIEAVRPGYRGVTRDLDVRPGDHLTLDLHLQRSGSR